MTNFSQYNLNQLLNKSLKNINFKNKKQKKEKRILLILQKNDI